MQILVLNPGTSSIKFGTYRIDNNEAIELERTSRACTSDTFTEVLQHELQQYNLSDTIIGIRIVHGGWKYQQATKITDEVITYIQTITDLAPLHNPLALQTISSIQSLGTFPMIAVFDTAFHATLPDKAKYYALPKQLSDTYHIQRYGFHGLAYASMLRTYCQQFKVNKEQAVFIGLQLGSGCSICAIQNGQSVDTSMGFSPLEGLISRTRTGNIDPAVIDYVHKEAQLSYEDIFTILNKESGLKGLSGTEGHLQLLSEVSLAVDMFVYRIQQYIGAYDVVLKGQHPILFGGGISEHSQEVLKLIAANPYLNLKLISPEYNKPITRITADDSPRHAYVVFVDEEREIANGVIDVIRLQ